MPHPGWLFSSCSLHASSFLTVTWFQGVSPLFFPLYASPSSRPFIVPLEKKSWASQLRWEKNWVLRLAIQNSLWDFPSSEKRFPQLDRFPRFPRYYWHMGLFPWLRELSLCHGASLQFFPPLRWYHRYDKHIFWFPQLPWDCWMEFYNKLSPPLRGWSPWSLDVSFFPFPSLLFLCANRPSFVDAFPLVPPPPFLNLFKALFFPLLLETRLFSLFYSWLPFLSPLLETSELMSHFFCLSPVQKSHPPRVAPFQCFRQPTFSPHSSFDLEVFTLVLLGSQGSEFNAFGPGQL